MTANAAWEELFDRLDIRSHLDRSGKFDLSAIQIKRITGKEPRNMSKWDSRAARPDVLKKEGVTILPTSRQGYVLLKGDGYIDVPTPEPAVFHSPKKLERFTTLSWQDDITKESLVIDIAAVSSMLRAFTGDNDLALTIRGRSGTAKFDFLFSGIDRTHRIVVDRAQVELDAGFEGDRVWLVEAKMGEPSDFLTRQLFYPWREWQALSKKSVVPLFITYSNRTFGFFRYVIHDEKNYHSIELVEKRWFTLDEPKATPSLGDLFAATKAVRPTTLVFPQADSLGTVVAATELCSTGVTVREVSKALNFDERQGAYYTSAAAWVGFVVPRGVERQLTARGKSFVDSGRWERFEMLFQAIASTPIFRDFIRRRLETRHFTDGEIAEEILEKNFGNRTTSLRRAKTVRAWLDWLWREHANLAATR